MVNYEELQQLVAFSKAGTLAEVAEQFHISQPSVTRNMKKIEAEFGVSLFERTKNSVALNDTGRLAASEAAIAIKQMQDMIKRVQDYDRANHTVSLGSCAAVPITDLNRQIMSSFPDSTITANVKSVEELLSGIEDNTYQLIILPYETDNKEFAQIKIGEEHLMFYLPVEHHLAKKSSLTLADMNGENMLLYQKIGFWYDIVTAKMPDSKFLMQTERYSFRELIIHSIMPAFVTDVSMRNATPIDRRVCIPITDPEVNVSYYLTCKKENRNKFSSLFT